MLRRRLHKRFTDQASASLIVGEDGLEVPLEDKGAVSLEKQGPARLNDAPESFAHERGVLTEVLRNDRRSALRARMVSRIGEAGKPLQKDLEFEELLDFPFQG
jgi:hypothetical protein